MTDKLYAERDPRDLEPYFSRHMMAMTAEKLNTKAAIAEELAYRDKQIHALEKMPRCDECDDTGICEDRAGKHVCVCMEENGLYQKLVAEIETLQAENMCDICGGTGVPASSGLCGCSGSGRMSDAARYFRRLLDKKDRELDQVRRELKATTHRADALEKRYLPCPDHRDKHLTGDECLMCQLETARAMAEDFAWRE